MTTPDRLKEEEIAEKGRIVFENGSGEFIDRAHNLSAEYVEGYRDGLENAFKWRSPKTLPSEDGAEAILWLTTDKGFADVSAHCYLKGGFWHWVDSDERIKRPDLIKGWLPWPEPPAGN